MLALLVSVGTCWALLLKHDSDGRALWSPDVLGMTVTLSTWPEAGAHGADQERSSLGKGELPVKENGEGGPS